MTATAKRPAGPGVREADARRAARSRYFGCACACGDTALADATTGWPFR